MWRRLALLSLASCVAARFGGTPPSSSAMEEARPPNLIVVFIDDMGWSDLSCFGNQEASTPAIDSLAAEGRAFEQFYVNSPICSPSRVALTTGQYPQRLGITSYLDHRRSNEARGMRSWLEPATPTLPRALQRVGYRTGHFGKWHMGGQRDVDDAPPITAYGFDTSLTNFEGMGPKLLPLTRRPGDAEPGRIWAGAERLGPGAVWMQRSEITGGFVDAALEFIDEAQAEGRPFYLNLWPDDVHSPYWPPVEDWREGKRGQYLAVLKSMDRQLAPLFERVRSDPELCARTLIVLCSDNGPERGAGRSDGLKGYKTHLYEGGIRSPLLVWGPGLMQAHARGTRDADSVLAAIDLVPTLLELGGAEQLPGLDGESLPGTLLGSSPASREMPLFFARPPDRKSFYGFEDLPDLAVRQGRWKLLCDRDGSRPELHDLLVDPGERRNLAGDYPERVAELRSRLLSWAEGL